MKLLQTADGRLLHEAVWAPLVLVGLAVARWAPEPLFAAFACPFRAATGLPCLTCGGTRAVRALVQLDLGSAFAMNPLVTVLGLLGAAYVVHAIRVLFGRARPWRPELPPRPAAVARAGAIASVTASWAYLVLVGR